jgi:hypothetical protein
VKSPLINRVRPTPVTEYTYIASSCFVPLNWWFASCRFGSCYVIIMHESLLDYLTHSASGSVALPSMLGTAVWMPDAILLFSPAHYSGSFHGLCWVKDGRLSGNLSVELRQGFFEDSVGQRHRFYGRGLFCSSFQRATVSSSLRDGPL